MSGSNRQVFSVSELNRDAKRLLESEFPSIFVEGEISNFAKPSSGHWYFTLKDDRAQIRCAMFRNRNHMVRFQPSNGKQVIVKGRISLYEGRGEFQMIADILEESGEGALRQAYEKLKANLQAEGLFDESRKQAIPEMPTRIAIVTSPSGAAIRDVFSVMRRRFPAIHITILPVQVQGDISAAQIVTAIELANSQPFDLILLTRGGGSLEDLWSFNTEPVARAIAASDLPIVNAVGHESDVTIADFVADLRAPTPSAAAELITPDKEVWQDTLNYLLQRLINAAGQQLQDGQRTLSFLTKQLQHPRRRLTELSQRLDELERRLVGQGERNLQSYDFDQLARRLHVAVKSGMDQQRRRLRGIRLATPAHHVQSARQQLTGLQDKLINVEAKRRQQSRSQFAEVAAKLNAMNPLATLQRGYAIVSSGQHIITEAEAMKPGDTIKARLKKGQIEAQVTLVEREVEGET